MTCEYLAPDSITSCPACGGIESVQVGGVATAFDAAAGPTTLHQPAYAIRYCARCGLYFKSHTVDLEALDEYYERLQCDTYEVGETFPTERYLRRWLDGLPNHSRVLDFGCSTGRMLKGLSGRLTCFGVEVNPVAAGIARGRGIQIVSEQQLRAWEPCDFDAILLADVYEHLVRPVELAAMLVGLLKPGGWLAIVTGNANAIRTRDRMAEFWYFRTPAHLLMAGERHASWLAAHLGLRLEVLHRCSHYATPAAERVRQFVRSAAYHQFRRSPSGRITEVLRRLPWLSRADRWQAAPAVTFGRDHMVVLFRKS